MPLNAPRPPPALRPAPLPWVEPTPRAPARGSPDAEPREGWRGPGSVLRCSGSRKGEGGRQRWEAEQNESRGSGWERRGRTGGGGEKTSNIDSRGVCWGSSVIWVLHS